MISKPRTLIAANLNGVTVCDVSIPGKTLLAKAVANQTSATFLRVVGSELIQKYLVSIFIMNTVAIKLYVASLLHLQ